VNFPTQLSETLSKAFTAAILLTGTADAGEAAVLEGIDKLDGSVDAKLLFSSTVRAAISRGDQISRAEEDDRICREALPCELVRVLQLPGSVRQSFVLRTLVGMPLEACAELLGIEEGQVSDRVCAGLRLVAGIPSPVCAPAR
jgi:hypothetical protein